MNRLQAEDKAETLNRCKVQKRQKRQFSAAVRDGQWVVLAHKDRKTSVWAR